MKRLFVILGNLLCGAALLLALVMFVAPRFLEITFHTIVSDSMRPNIAAGDVVVLDGRTTSYDLQVGDIIAFQAPGIDTPVTHRLIAISDVGGEDTFRTKGDALEEADSWVLRGDQILGKVVARVPKLGYLTGLLRTRYGFGLLMVLPAFMILALETKELVYPSPTSNRRRDGLEEVDRTPAYLWLLTCLIVTGTMCGLMVGLIESRNLSAFDRLDRGDDQLVFRRTIRNTGPLPVLILLTSDGDQVVFEQSYFWLAPGSRKSIEMVSSSPEAIVTTGGLPPIAPPRLLYHLFAWNHQLTAIIVPAVPGLVLAVTGFVVLGGLSSRRIHRRKRTRAMRRIGQI